MSSAITDICLDHNYLKIRIEKKKKKKFLSHLFFNGTNICTDILQL